MFSQLSQKCNSDISEIVFISETLEFYFILAELIISEDERFCLVTVWFVYSVSFFIISVISLA
jgi:hypothetical protein